MDAERDLVARSRAGDRRAFATLIERHQVAALRVATAIVGSGGQAEDVVQEAFIKSFTRLDQFDGTGASRRGSSRSSRTRPATGAAATVAVTALTLRLATPEHATSTDTTTDPARAQEASELRHRLAVALAALGDRDREVVALRYFADLSEAEMAESMGCPVGTGEVAAEPGPRPPAGLDLDGGPAVNPSTPGPSHADLEVGLRDLGAHLDVGSAALADVVVARLADGDRPSDRRPDPRRLRQLAAAILVVTLAALAALSPTREAIADWLGVGGVRITQTDRPPPTGRPARPPSPTLPPTALDDVAADLSFDVRRADPALAGRPLAVAVDPRVATGVLEIRYRAFTLVQLASAPGEPPVLEEVRGRGHVGPPDHRGRARRVSGSAASHTRSVSSGPTAGSMRTPSAGPATCSSGRTPA